MRLDLLPVEIDRDTLRPDFLDARDHPWLSLLVAEYQRFTGRKERELDARLQEAMPASHSLRKRLLAQAVLDRCWRRAASQSPTPRSVRAAIFAEASDQRAQGAYERHAAMRAGATALRISVQTAESSLFGDMPGERVLVEVAQPPSVSELALRANLHLVKALMLRATTCSFTLYGTSRPVIRQAKLRGLICVMQGSAAGDDVKLEVSGPLSLLAHTTLYGRALGELVAPLAACSRFSLRVALLMRGRRCHFELGSGAPVFPAQAQSPFDSKLEARFAKDFLASAPEWDLVREPRPVQAGGSLIFPDFELSRRGSPGDRWCVEIAGFWTPEYVQTKLAHYRAARLDKLILCLDAERSCGPDALPANARIVRFRRHIDPQAILAIIAGEPRVTSVESEQTSSQVYPFDISRCGD